MSLAKRESNHDRYVDEIFDLAAKSLEKFQVRQMLFSMLKFYEPYAKAAILAFLDGQESKLPSAKEELVAKVTEKDALCADAKLSKIVHLISIGQNKRAIRAIEDGLMEEECDEKALRKLLLQAHVEAGTLGTPESQKNVDRLIECCTAEEVAKLEDEYPVLIDEQIALQQGQALFAERRFAEALPWFERAAKKGNVEALYKLGEMYFVGRGVEKDQARGVAFYKDAAKAGSVGMDRLWRGVRAGKRAALFV